MGRGWIDPGGGCGAEADRPQDAPLEDPSALLTNGAVKAEEEAVPFRPNPILV